MMMLRITPVVGRNKSLVCLLDGILYLLDHQHRGLVAPEVEIEVMVLNGTLPDSRGKIPALIVRPITNDDILVEHGGFQHDGKTTRAALAVHSDTFIKRACGRGLGWVSPGRTPVPISKSGPRRLPPIPDKAYVTRRDIRDGHQRICGVPSISCLNKEFVRSIIRREAL